MRFAEMRREFAVQLADSFNEEDIDKETGLACIHAVLNHQVGETFEEKWDNITLPSED